LLSVSPFAVTGSLDVGEVFPTFGPSVDFPLGVVTPDCVWLRTLSDVPAAPPMRDESLRMAPPVAPLLERRFMFELLVVFEPLLMFELPIEVSWLMLEPPIPVVSVAAGAMLPPADVVSMAFVLSPLLHAASTAATATIAMRFMICPSKEMIRERCAARPREAAPICSSSGLGQ
jgi:hypothetical protein